MLLLVDDGAAEVDQWRGWVGVVEGSEGVLVKPRPLPTWRGRRVFAWEGGRVRFCFVDDKTAEQVDLNRTKGWG